MAQRLGWVEAMPPVCPEPEFPLQPFRSRVYPAPVYHPERERAA